MADGRANSVFPWSGSRLSANRLLKVTLCLACLAVWGGCGGCLRTTPRTAEEAEKAAAELREKLRKKEKKPDFVVRSPLAVPHERETQICWYKPGHWTSALMPVKTNNFDLLGDLETTALDGSGEPLGLPGMPFCLSGVRPVALPKGWPKTLDVRLFVPRSTGRAHLGRRITTRKTGLAGWESDVPPGLFRQMPSYQYHFVVLARWPESYTYIKKLDPVAMPSYLDGGYGDEGHYRVSLIASRRPIALPGHSLFWSSIACLLWDDFDPDLLLLDQQLALLDWLHWGGQLILSGPDTLDTLHNSFLAPYLPVSAAGTRQVSEADLDELNQQWAVPEGPSKTAAPLAPLKPWSGVALARHAGARDVPRTGGLLVERRVGRGRVVVSAFRLSGRELKNWPGRHSFFNGCLLGRPARQFADNDGLLQAHWATDTGCSGRESDPLLVSQVRYFSRDCGRPVTRRTTSDDFGDDFGQQHASGPSVAEWNDFGPVATAARQALTAAAEIEIPRRTFVVWVMAGYLLVLVPVNWLVFRLVGRVEWAWAAAPIVAILCTVVVIRLARLDIGFARSLNEIAVVELQGDYPRAHVTRYTALYTSLSTSYDLASDDPAAQLQPFPKVADPNNFKLSFGQTHERLRYRYGKEARLENFRIISNSADMVHSEQMVDLGGPLQLVETKDGRNQVVNRTAYAVHGADVIRVGERGLETAWVGTLAPGASARLNFAPGPEKTDASRRWEDQRNRSTPTAANNSLQKLNLSPLFELAESRNQKESGFSLHRGDCWLVGWMDEEIPGLTVSPAAPQARRAAVVVAHLSYGFGNDPRRDKNTLAEVRKTMPRTFSLPEIDQTDSQ